MKSNKKYFIALICAIWIVLIYILKKENLMTFDMEIVKQYINSHINSAILIFITLWMGRLLVFIPGVALMILGGVCFGTAEGFLLSMTGMVISSTMIYMFANLFKDFKLRNFINKRYSKLDASVKKYNCRFLALGIICPVAPTDVACFLSATTGINYFKYILTIVIANIPLVGVYSYIRTGFNGSIFNITLLVLSMLFISYYSVKMWNSIKMEQV